MSNVPRLNYFVENETAEAATKNFALILQKAFKNYRKLWDKYLDLVKKCEVDNPICEDSQEEWKKETILNSIRILPENIDFLTKSKKEEEKCDRTANKSIIKDIFETCTLDFDSDIEDTIYQTPCKETKNVILPESPIFMRKDENSVSTISKNESFTDDNNQSNPPTVKSDITSEEHLDISFSNISPVIICNTPMSNNEYNRKKKKRFHKKAFGCKQLNDNPFSPGKQQVREKKIPLQVLENNASPLKAILSHNENKTNYEVQNARWQSFAQYQHHKVSPTDNKSLRQTTLPFYKIKNKLDNSAVTSSNKNVPIIRPKKFLFNSISYTDEVINDKKIDTIRIDNVNNQNETICGDVVGKSPDNKDKNPLKLKRKFPEIKNGQEINELLSNNCDSLAKTQNQACLTKKRNIVCDNSPIFLTPGIVSDDAKEKCLKNTQLKQNSCIEQHESTLFDVFQTENADDTYFEEENTNINENIKTVKEESIRRLTQYESENKENSIIKSNGTTELTKKNNELERLEGWSCWECAEYYGNKPGITEEELKLWKNQCSRHRNVYYARAGTPPGFWDPLLPETPTDSIQEN